MNIHLDAPIECLEQSIQNNDVIAWISTTNKGKCFRIHKRHGKIATPPLKCIHLYIYLNEKLYGSSMYVCMYLSNLHGAHLPEWIWELIMIIKIQFSKQNDCRNHGRTQTHCVGNF